MKMKKLEFKEYTPKKESSIDLPKRVLQRMKDKVLQYVIKTISVEAPVELEYESTSDIPHKELTELDMSSLLKDEDEQ